MCCDWLILPAKFEAVFVAETHLSDLRTNREKQQIAEEST